MNLQSQLLDGSRALGIELSDQQASQMIGYLGLLQKWNRAFNLTAITDPDKMLSYHLLDSLSVAGEFRDAKNVLDVGSGAGLPGIPLAILQPVTQWVLLDSNGKKTRFIQQAVADCSLHNVEVVQARVEDYHAPFHLDVIVSRAYASLGKFCASVSHLLSPDTKLVTMKTALQAAEMAEFDSNRFTLQQHDLRVPGIDEQRTLVTISQLS